MGNATWGIILGIVLVIPITTFRAAPAIGEAHTEISFATVSSLPASGDDPAGSVPLITRIPAVACALPAHTSISMRVGCLCQWHHDGCWGLVVQTSGWVLGINCGDGYQYWSGSGPWGGDCQSAWDCY